MVSPDRGDGSPTDPCEEQDSRARGRRAATWLVILLPLSLFLWSGLRGIDYGRHWDEKLRVRSLKEAVEAETLLPESYNYPSVTFWVTVAALGPEAIGNAELRPRERPAYLQSLAERVASPEFLLRMRTVFLCLCALALVWVYLLVLKWRGRRGEALVAACALGFSWEIGYHSRWVAPDVLMMQFCALSLLLVFCALRHPERRRWLVFAAITAGVATGTKYNAGLMILPVLFACWRCRSSAPGRSPLALAAGLVGIFALTFLITTPGALLNPLMFVRDVRYEVRHYGTLGHYGFTVEAGWEHFVQNVRYLVESGPSHFPVVSLIMTLLALLGAGAILRESWSDGLLLVGIPLFYLLYMSMQRVLFVRNLLFIAPFAAIWTARGVGWVWDLARQRRLRIGLMAATSLLLALNAGWLVYAGESSRDRSSERFVRAFHRYLEGNPDDSFFISRLVAEQVASAGLELPENATREPGAVTDYVALLPDELRAVQLWPGIVRGLPEVLFGPWEVNFEYYATWLEPRILVLEWERARDLAQPHERPWIRKIFPDLPDDPEGPPE